MENLGHQDGLKNQNQLICQFEPTLKYDLNSPNKPKTSEKLTHTKLTKFYTFSSVSVILDKNIIGDEMKMKNWHALSVDLLEIRWIFLEGWWEVLTRGQSTSWWGCSEHWPCRESESIFIARKIKQVTWYVSNQWQAYGSLEKLPISRGNSMHYKIITVLSEDDWKCHQHLVTQERRDNGGIPW